MPPYEFFDQKPPEFRATTDFGGFCCPWLLRDLRSLDCGLGSSALGPLGLDGGQGLLGRGRARRVLGDGLGQSLLVGSLDDDALDGVASS